MVRYLIQRPIAVLTIFITLTLAGILLIGKVPVSLLPDIDVPQIIVRIDYPNTPAAQLEENIVKTIREGLANIDHLKTIESKSSNHMGLLYLTFEYGTKMKLAFIDVNEKLDRLTNLMPRDLPRPHLMRINTSDILVVRVQVTPKEGTNYAGLSEMSEKILKKRLEQLEGVSMVDINGLQHQVISITPNNEALHALGETDDIIVQAVQNVNHELGGITVRDGQYRYFVKVLNALEDERAIAQLPLRLKDGSVITIGKVAVVEQEIEKQTGYHLYNGREGIVFTVQKQPDSRMNELVPEVKKAVESFKKEYPSIDFALTQDQTFLLDAGISNLKQDLIYAGILTILILYLFLGNWSSPGLMGISIPISLIITFVLFYLFGISFNIISLSGLALGIGMLIDNSIVVIDSIARQHQRGKTILDSSVDGTNEVLAPVISQVLTTIAVYAPLIILSGMPGVLIADQAIGLTISLGVSLLVAFVLTPLLYKLLAKKGIPVKENADTRLYKWIVKGYHRMIHHILKHKLIYFLATILLMPIGFWLSAKIPVSALPSIEKKESLLSIDWNIPIDAGENLRRIKELEEIITPRCIVTEAEIGIRQFLLQQDNNNVEKSSLYFACESEKLKTETDKQVVEWVKAKYPSALVQIMDAPNAFTQLFALSSPFMEARFKPIGNSLAGDSFKQFEEVLERNFTNYKQGPGFLKESNLTVLLDYNKLAIYGISKPAIEDVLQKQFGIYTVTEIKRFGTLKSIRLKTNKNDLAAKLASKIVSYSGAIYPLSYFLSLSSDNQQKFITADKTGEFRSITFDNTVRDIPLLQRQLTAIAAENGFSVEFTGQYFDNKEQIGKLRVICLIVLALLYLILAMQYEDLLQPVLVMCTIPLGITGGMLLLWLTGGTFDVMAAIGFIVILGLVVDDPILKIETLNRLEKKYRQQGLPHDDKLLEKMIHEAGDICLKPLLMVSLTTSIALVPGLFIGGIGNELQRPLAIVIIGGLTIGTFFTTWFIPLAYWYVTKWRYKIQSKRKAL